MAGALVHKEYLSTGLGLICYCFVSYDYIVLSDCNNGLWWAHLFDLHCHGLTVGQCDCLKSRACLPRVGLQCSKVQEYGSLQECGDANTR